MAVSMKTYGTKRAISESGVESVMDAAISLAKVVASSLVWGLSFQFPLIKGLRAISNAVVDEDRETKAGEKAEAEDNRAAVTPRNFIFDIGTIVWWLLGSGQEDVWLGSEGFDYDPILALRFSGCPSHDEPKDRKDRRSHRSNDVLALARSFGHLHHDGFHLLFMLYLNF